MLGRVYSTKQVAACLGVKRATLARAVYDGRIAAPQRGPGDAFLWMEADVHRASRYFRHRDASDVLPTAEGVGCER